MASSELLLRLKTFDDDEPRIRDLDLAVALGYSNPAQIRELIQRHREQLEEFGVIRMVRITPGDQGGRPATENWLTERQALLLCTYAETQKADEVRFTLVNTFMAYKGGKLVPAAPTVQMSILDIQKRQIEAVVDTRLFTITSKVDVIENKIDTGFAAVLAGLTGVKQDVAIIADDCKRRRRDVTWEDRAKAISCLHDRRHGICPCCNVIEILARGLPNEEFEMDHFFGRHLAKLNQVWPVCRRCNQGLNESTFRQQHQSDFQAWQHALVIHLEPPLLRGIKGIEI